MSHENQWFSIVCFYIVYKIWPQKLHFHKKSYENPRFCMPAGPGFSVPDPVLFLLSFAKYWFRDLFWMSCCCRAAVVLRRAAFWSCRASVVLLSCCVVLRCVFWKIGCGMTNAVPEWKKNCLELKKSFFVFSFFSYFLWSFNKNAWFASFSKENMFSLIF